MKLLDDLNKRKKLKMLVEELEKDVNNIKTVEDVKTVLSKVVNMIKDLI